MAQLRVPYPSKPEKQAAVALLTPKTAQFVVIDNRTVITGSFNWSPSAAHQNDEVLLVIESPLLAAHFTREMDRLWQGAVLRISHQCRDTCWRGARHNGRTFDACGLDHPLWMLLPWVVFAVAAGSKFWRITSAIRQNRLGRPNRTEQFKQSLERIWLSDS